MVVVMGVVCLSNGYMFIAPIISALSSCPAEVDIAAGQVTSTILTMKCFIEPGLGDGEVR